MEPLLTVTSVLSCVLAPFKNAAQQLTSLRVQRKSVLQLAIWAGWSYRLEKSVKNFALSYPQSAYPLDLVLPWPLLSPHPGQSCLVEVRKFNDPPGF